MSAAQILFGIFVSDIIEIGVIKFSSYQNRIVSESVTFRARFLTIVSADDLAMNFGVVKVFSEHNLKVFEIHGPFTK